MINGWRRIGLRSRREEGWSRPRNGRLKELLPLRRALAITKSRSGIWRTTSLSVNYTLIAGLTELGTCGSIEIFCAFSDLCPYLSQI